MPKISVILPAFNAGDYLQEAVQSVLGQTFRDFNLYVIDDGSTDSSINTISSIKDHRLKVFHNDSNKGLIHSLNLGIHLANASEYIARMDADDVCHPLRFQFQIDYLEKNPRVGVLGTGMRYFGDSKFSRNWKNPSRDEVIRTTMFGRNPIAHPTVMMRSHLLASNHYDPEFQRYEDYALWIDLLEQCEFANIEKVLLNYRRHSSNITNSYKFDCSNDIQVYSRLIRKLSNSTNVAISDDQLTILAAVTSTSRAKFLPKFSIAQVADAIEDLLSKVSLRMAGGNLLSDFLWGQVLRYSWITNQAPQACLLIIKRIPSRLPSIASTQYLGS